METADRWKRAVIAVVAAALAIATAACSGGGHTDTALATGTATTIVARRPFVPPDCTAPHPPQEPVIGDRILTLRVGSSWYTSSGTTMPASASGPVVGTVCREDLGWPDPADGDGPFPAGTPLHAIRGYDPTFRLGVLVGDELAVLEVFADDRARIGNDLYDLSIGVDAVEIHDFNFNASDTPIETWTDERVDKLVAGLLRAPLDTEAGLTSVIRLGVVLNMRDGTTVRRALDPSTGFLAPLRLDNSTRSLFAGITLPQSPPYTTTPATEPTTTLPPRPVTAKQVTTLAQAFGLSGEIEVLSAEHGDAQCIQRLASPGLCINAPLWGLWQYWDVEAQNLPGATDADAVTVAAALVQRLGLPHGPCQSSTQTDR